MFGGSDLHQRSHYPDLLRIRTLKKDWSIVYDMLSGKNNSSFGWDEHSSLLLLTMRCGTHVYIVIKKPVNSNIIVSVIMTNLLPSTQKIEPLGKMLKQPLILLKK